MSFLKAKARTQNLFGTMHSTNTLGGVGFAGKMYSCLQSVGKDVTYMVTCLIW